jgi:hypothetical protein
MENKMSQSFNPIEGFAEELMERRLRKEARILKAVLILKNGEARNVEAVSETLRKDLEKWAKIILEQALALKKAEEAKKPKESERAKRIREREIEKQNMEVRERASFIRGVLSLQATLDCPGLHCKAKCRAPNRGYYRPPPPSPSGKGPKIKFQRPKRVEEK